MKLMTVAVWVLWLLLGVRYIRNHPTPAAGSDAPPPAASATPKGQP